MIYICYTGVFFQYLFSILGMQLPHVVSSSLFAICIHRVDSRKRSSSLWEDGPGSLVSGVVRESHSPYGNPGVPIPRRGATSLNTDVTGLFIGITYRVIAIKDKQIGGISYSVFGTPSCHTGRKDLDLVFTCWYFCFMLHQMTSALWPRHH